MKPRDGTVEETGSVTPRQSGTSAPISQDLKALTGVRFFAAMWVALFHVRPELEKLVPSIQSFLSIFQDGHLAVPFFFILSGFILSHSYFPRYRLADHGHFVVLRFARMWPVHAFTLGVLAIYAAALSTVSTGAGNSSAYPWSALPAELGMIRCWFDNSLVWNYPAWSIHSEWFAYLFLFPVAFVAFRRISSRIALVAITAVLLVCHSFVPTEKVPGKCLDILFLFLAGSAAYQLRICSGAIRGNWIAGVGFGLFAVAAFLGGEGLVLYLSFALIIFGLSYDGAITRGLSHPIMIYGGSISYSLYMTHALVQKFFGELSKRVPSGSSVLQAVMALALVCGIVAVAAATYHLVEAPGNRMLRKWARRRFPDSRCAT